MIEKTAYAGWPTCYQLTDGRIEAVATSDIGPRIVRLGFVGGENLFGALEEQLGLKGDQEWRLYGGHRFWHSPEARPRSYYPDNDPIEVQIEENALHLLQPTEPTTSIRKTIEVALVEGHIEVVHTLTNEGLWPVELAPWALSVMALRSVAIIPQPTSADPAGLLPNRVVMLWPYTDMTDRRVHWGRKFILLRQDPTQSQPIKLGLSADDGWCACLCGETLFLKRFDYFVDALYPDNGCTVESYANDRFLELETLGPLVYLEPGDSTTHLERWYLFAGVRPDVTNEDDIQQVLGPLVEQTA